MDYGNLLNQYGLAGLVIMTLAGVCVILYKKVEKLTQMLLDLQDTRRQEAIETSRELTRTLETFSQSTQMLVSKVVDVQRRAKR